MQHGLLGPPGVRALHLQPQYLGRAGTHATATARAALGMDLRKGFAGSRHVHSLAGPHASTPPQVRGTLAW
jgi:hypothetical protein